MKNANTTFKFILLLIFTISLIIVFSSCRKWVYNEELDGVQFEKYRYSISDNDTVSIIGYINENKVINGIPCAAGWVHFTSDMKLKMFCLSQNTQINNVMLPTGTWVVSNYTDDLLVVVFPEDTMIGVLPVKGGGNSKGVQTAFYNNGNVKSFFPFKKFEYHGNQYKKSILNSIKLNEEGEIID
jgi:hypothetical protein